MGMTSATPQSSGGTEETDGVVVAMRTGEGGTAPPEKSPREEVWDSLVAHFGNPRTKTERTMFGRVVKELLEAGATSEETDKACQYVLASFDNPSVNAVPKWLSRALMDTGRKSAQQLEIDKLREMR